MKIKVLLPNNEWSKTTYTYLTTVVTTNKKGDPVFHNIVLDDNTGRFTAKNMKDCRLYKNAVLHPDILPD